MTSPYETQQEAFYTRQEQIGVPYLREMVGMTQDDRDIVEKETLSYLLDCTGDELTAAATRVEHLYASAANSSEAFFNREVDVFARALLGAIEVHNNQIPPTTAQQIGSTVLRARYMNPAALTRAEFPYNYERQHRLLFAQ